MRLNKLVLATTLVAAAPVGAAAADLERLEHRIEELEAQIEATASAVERGEQADRVAVGGYGELHYNILEGRNGASDKKEIDFHRFVLFFGHEFNESTRFFSELELEHALSGEGQPGEVELEQAYVEFDLTPGLRAKGGLFLLPVGILNETHEPPTFYGVERNMVEKEIIPTTWWEGGAALTGRFGGGFTYDVAVHSGLSAAGYDLRGARQKVAEAEAESLAYTGRIKWTGRPGLELAATVNSQSDIRQGIGKAVGATLFETHAAYQTGPFGFRALYAQWDLDDDGTAAGADEQKGWYLEPSYRLNDKVGVFGRYSLWDTAAGDSTDSEWTQTDVGMNFRPHPDVVVKVDYQDQSAPAAGGERDGFNLGIGYQF